MAKTKAAAGNERFRISAKGDLIGAHMSTKGGLPTGYARAKTIGASAIAVFTKNSSQWKAKPLTDEDCQAFRSAREGTDVEAVLSHASYLINLAAVNEEFYEKSIVAMGDELTRAEKLGISAVVLHPGAHMGEGVDKGVDRIARSLDRIHKATEGCTTTTLLETAAGQGSCLGCSFEELGRMLRLVDDRARVGICIDTCHVFAAGYDIRERAGYEAMVDEMLQHVGLENVGAFHLNDSKKPLGSRVDRHEHIGEGLIGRDAFALLLNDERFRGIPKVLETPKPDEFDADIRNLTLLRSLVDTAG